MDRRTLFCDVDETLLCHDISEFPKGMHVTVKCNGRSFVGVPHIHNINMLIKFYKLGYDCYVWSKTGKSWASAVTKQLKLQKYVAGYLTKPDFYLDDLSVEKWMGPRVYRDAKSGVQDR